MQIKAIWGFKGDPGVTKTTEGRVRAGDVIDVAEEYGHTLIGKGLAEAVGDSGRKAPKGKPATPEEKKPATSEDKKPDVSGERKPAAPEEKK
ncbi:hypothetical protein [Luteibacter sp. SG786]|uniref:hypothetical protein n=1 Tax=Luteibacter sp. SG786 TaxID=2587130 RepID=UPI00141E7C68|nr:hypothetical protein [Luteibacter sp. SG786]NII53581.1 hypothetical protein [Luteibacter sp. SG786]